MSESPDKPIPSEFDSEYEERPFQSCSRCGEQLSSFDNYQINKAFRNGECVFEYAFCAVCRDALLEEFSEESKANLERHQKENMHAVNGTGECCFCGTSRAQSPMRDFMVTALCRGSSLLDSLMICGGCQDSIQELLSEKTKEVRRKFFESLPGVPPDWEPEPITEESPNLKPAIAKTGPSRTRPDYVGVPGANDDCGTDLIWQWRHA